MRKVERDNLGIIFIFQNKNMHCGLILMMVTTLIRHVPSQKDTTSLCVDVCVCLCVRVGEAGDGVWFPAHSNATCTGYGVKIDPTNH